MKKIFITAYMLQLAMMAIAQQVTITGHIKGPATGYNKIYIQGDGVKEDSAIIENGTFSFHIPFKGPIIPYLYSEYDLKVRGSFRMAGLVIDRAGEVIMDSIDLSKGMNSALVKGMESAREFVQYEKIFAETRKAVAAELPPLPEYDTPEYEAHIRKFDSIYRIKLSPVIVDAAKEYGSHYAFAVALDAFGKSASPEFLEEAYKLLSKDLQSSAPGQRVKFYLEGLKNSINGSTVADFSLTGPDGKTISFHQFKGKYVMIDFWASWCIPCRESFPRMRKLYDQYKGNKFEILSISIDRKKPDWDKAVVEEKLPWPQVLDTKSIAQRQFAVTAVPTAYLIGPDGKIILKEIGFEQNSEVEQELKKLFP